MIAAKPADLVLQLCSLACFFGWSSPTALANFHKFPPFVHPSLNIDFIEMSTWNPSGVTSPGAPIIISNGIQFVGTALDGNATYNSLQTTIDFLWQHPRGVRSMSYEAFGGYLFEDAATEQLSADAAIWVEVWDANDVPTSTAAASGVTSFGKDAEADSTGQWSLKIDVNFDDIVGADNHATKAAISITAGASHLPFLVGEGHLWTDSIRLTFVSVPEPTGFALAGLGISMLGLARGKMRAS